MNHDISYYRKIQGMNGVSSFKEAELRNIKAELLRDFENSLDCEEVEINGVDSKLLVTKSTDHTIKHVVSKPDSAIYLGDIINWCDTDWIVDVIDADNRIVNRGKMRRCNVVLNWIDDSGTIHSYPGFCDTTTGDGVLSRDMLQTADTRIKVKIHLDEHSAKISRDKRFLIGSGEFLPQIESVGEHPIAYIVTRSNTSTNVHNGHGYVELTLYETAYSKNDNPELMIADYYKDTDEYVISIDDVDRNLTIAKDSTFELSVSATKNGVEVQQTSIC